MKAKSIINWEEHINEEAIFSYKILRILDPQTCEFTIIIMINDSFYYIVDEDEFLFWAKAPREYEATVELEELYLEPLMNSNPEIYEMSKNFIRGEKGKQKFKIHQDSLVKAEFDILLNYAKWLRLSEEVPACYACTFDE